MQRYLSLLLIVTLSLFANTAHSMETTRVIVLPFKVHAQEDLSYMKDEIPKLLKKHLKLEGAIVLESDAISEFYRAEKPASSDEIRNFGVFEVKPTKAKPRARNPRTNEEIYVPARRKTHFKPGKLLKEVLKQPIE